MQKEKLKKNKFSFNLLRLRSSLKALNSISTFKLSNQNYVLQFNVTLYLRLVKWQKKQS